MAESRNFNKRKQEAYNIFIFLLNPFVSIAFLVRRFSKITNPKTLIILISGFIGFAYFITPTADINSYIQVFKEYDKSLTQFVNTLFFEYGQNDKNLDFYIDFVSLILSPITSNVSVFLIVLGVIFGIFYSKYILIILQSIKNINLITGIFIFTFVIAINPQLGINSRFYVASACSLAGFYGFYLKKEKRGILLIFISIFIHLGVVAFFGLYLVFHLVKNKPLYAMIIALVSLGISGINLSSYANFFSGLGFSGVEHKLESYTSERMQDRFNIRYGEESVWFLKYRARFFFSAALILLSYFYFEKLKKFDTRTRYLFIAALLSVSFWNLINTFPMIYRYEPFLVIIVASFFIQLNGNYNLSPKQRLTQYMLIPFLLVFPAISLRNFLGAIPLHFFISNPIVEGFMESSKDIYSFLIP